MRRLAVGLVLTCVTSGLATALPTSPASDESFGPHSLKTHSGARSDVCNFCHTPQGRQSGGPDWATGQQVSEFPTYDNHGSNGGIDIRGSVSIACLSCHDGSQAPDSVANMPYASAALDNQNLQRPTALGHPVGVVFSGYGARATSGLIPSNRLQRDMIGGEVRWWLDMETVPDGVRDKTDVILYTQGAGAGAQPFVECASCHDPRTPPRATCSCAPRRRAATSARPATTTERRLQPRAWVALRGDASINRERQVRPPDIAP